MQRFITISAIALVAIALVFAPGALAQHEATVTQAGELGVVTIVQADTGNVAIVDQLADSDAATVNIGQSGTDSRVTVAQAGGPKSDSGNLVDVVQVGTGDNTNELTIAQGVTGVGSKDGAIGDAVSPDNTITANQGALAPGSGLIGVLTQTGELNIITLNQEGTDSDITVTQIGELDLGGNNIADVSQADSENTATVTQRFDAGVDNGLGTNDASIDQIGTGNIATVTQNGDNGIVDVIQEGNAIAEITQDGMTNTATITQKAGV
jgi:hypothetical protein